MTTTRGQRHLENIRREDIHDQQRRALASAHRTLDRLKNERDQLSEQPWHRPERRGQLVVLIRDAEQHIAELTACQEVERLWGMEPLPPSPVVELSGSRRVFPPAWQL